MIKHTHKGHEIIFNPDIHAYTSDDGIRYSTVTMNVARFFPKFNMTKQSLIYAINHNLNQNDVIKMWQKEGDESTKFGTIVHKYIERKLLNKWPKKSETKKEKIYFKIIDVWIAKFLKLYKPIGVEKVIFSPKFELAGTVDSIFECKRPGQIIVIDWKTCKEITRKNRWENCLYGLKNFQASHFNKFSFQLNSYLYILKKEDYFRFKQKPKLVVVHILESGIICLTIPILNSDVMDLII